MDVPKSASTRWSALLLAAIVSFSLLLLVALWQRFSPAMRPGSEGVPETRLAPPDATAPPPERDCLFPGSGVDSFGECPDSEGYYSSRRHFDLASPNRFRRALVMLEMDDDRSLHLRLSKADLASMPTVDETLPLAEFAPDESADDPLLPEFEVTRYENYGEGAGGLVERRLTPPVAGYELRLNGDELNEPLQLQSVDLASGKIVWTEEGLSGSFSRVEFFQPDPLLFFLFSDFDGGGVFHLRKGLLCRFQRNEAVPEGVFVREPLFLDDGRQFQFVKGETIWRLDLSDCGKRSVGAIVVPPRGPSRLASLATVAPNRDGSVLMAAIEERSGPVMARDPNPRRRQYVWLEYDGTGYVEKRRVRVRAHNAIDGFESISWEAPRSPLLQVSYFQSFERDPATGELDRRNFSGEISHILVRNEEGNFYALRAPLKGGGGQVDSKRGLLEYAGRWWDLKVLDRPLESDLR
jgi:hypothetical protein